MWALTTTSWVSSGCDASLRCAPSVGCTMLSSRSLPPRSKSKELAVGKEAQTCFERAIVPVNLANGEVGTYSAPVVPDSPIPALHGQKSLRANRSLIDTVHNKLYQLGPGEFKIVYPNGTRIYDLSDSPSGHMLHPVTEFFAVPGSTSSPSSSPKTPYTRSR